MNLIAVLVALALTMWTTASASAKTDTASVGDTTAALSYTASKTGAIRDVRVSVTRGGVVLVDEPLHCVLLAPGCTELRPSGFASKVITARNVDSDAEPEVLVDLAGPRLFSLLYDYAPDSRTYTRTQQAWSNHGYSLMDLDGDKVPEFQMYDERLTGDACDVPKPPQIFSYRAGLFVDVTRQFPKLIAREARGLWRCMERDACLSSPKVSSVAYLADMHLLGLEQRGWERMHALQRAGQFGSPVAARRHVRRLRRLMIKGGYARAGA